MLLKWIWAALDWGPGEVDTGIRARAEQPDSEEGGGLHVSSLAVRQDFAQAEKLRQGPSQISESGTRSPIIAILPSPWSDCATQRKRPYGRSTSGTGARSSSVGVCLERVCSLGP